MTPRKVVGIMGGMGPEATLDLFRRIIELSVARGARRDQDHLEVVISSVPETPDRTEAIRGGDRSIVPYLERSARRLEKAGADFIAVACHSVHYFLSDIRSSVSVPVLDMPAEVVGHLTRERPEARTVGLLATTGTVESGLFQDASRAAGITVLAPNPEDQRGLVMEAIYGPAGIKAGGDKTAARAALLQAADHLVSRGAVAVIAGCTEVSLALRDVDRSVPLIDATHVLAQTVVALAYS